MIYSCALTDGRNKETCAAMLNEIGFRSYHGSPDGTNDFAFAACLGEGVKKIYCFVGRQAVYAPIRDLMHYCGLQS
jgi:hypothetical protein